MYTGRLLEPFFKEEDDRILEHTWLQVSKEVDNSARTITGYYDSHAWRPEFAEEALVNLIS